MPPRRFVWLACQSDAATSTNKSVPSDSMRFVGSKMRHLLAAVPAIAHKITAGGDDDAPAGIETSAGGSASMNQYHRTAVQIGRAFGKKIVGLAIVEPCTVYDGMLSVLDFEQRAILQFVADSSKRVGSTFLRVLEAVGLEEPKLPVVSGVKAYANHKSFVMTKQGVESLMDCRLSDGQTVLGCMETWAEVDDYEVCITSLEDGSEGPPCALVCAPQLALLVAHGYLSYLVVPPSSRFAPHPYLNPLTASIRELRRPDRAIGNGPLLSTAEAQVLETECVQFAEKGLDRGMLLSIADTLRKHVSRSAGDSVDGAGCDVENQGVDGVDVQRQIVWLEGFYRASSQEEVSKSRLQRSRKGFEGIWDDDLGCMVTYKPAFLLQCVVLSFNLRSSSALPEVLKLAMGSLPAVWKLTLQKMLASAKTPSASTLSRARLSVDVGFMLWMKGRHASVLQDDSLTVFVKVDSTPLGGNNWEVVEYQMIEGDKLEKAGNAARALAQLGSKCAHTEVGAADAQQFHALTQDLMHLISHHVLPLGALGTRRSSIEHIIHSILFRLRLETFSWDHVEGLVRRTFSLTADQGTESKLGDVSSVDLSSNFPWWPPAQGQASQLASVHPDEHQDLEGYVSEEEHLWPVPAAPHRVSGFASSVRIPPHFHIIDKVSNALLDSLTLSWPRIEKGFKAVVAFFHAGHTRKHFIQLCVPAQVQFLFSQRTTCVGWEDVCGEFCNESFEWLLKREGAIKRNFDIEKLLNRPNANRTEQPRQPDVQPEAEQRVPENTKRDFFDDRDGSNMTVCAASVADPFFWASLHLLGQFCAILDHCQAWMLGCTCHPTHVRQELEKVLGRSGHEVSLQCPMRGRRGPDLATGQHKVVFNEVSHEQEDILFMVHLASLEDKDRRDLMLDFAAGRAKLATELDLRLSVWDTLPLKLFALAFHDPDIARQSVVECMLQFEELSQEEQDSAVHSLTSTLLSHSGPYRQLVVQWVQGQEYVCRLAADR